jgi:intracellular multiplication protein IcmK
MPAPPTGMPAPGSVSLGQLQQLMKQAQQQQQQQQNASQQPRLSMPNQNALPPLAAPASAPNNQQAVQTQNQQIQNQLLQMQSQLQNQLANQLPAPPAGQTTNPLATTNLVPASPLTPTTTTTTTTTTATTNATADTAASADTTAALNLLTGGSNTTTPAATSSTNKPAKLHQPLTFEESRQVMLNSAPPGINPPSDDETTAFNAMLQQNMPLSPQQVVQLRQQIDTAQRAAAIAPNVPPKPVSTTVVVNLAPGTTPPAVRLAQGYVSTLLFVDSTGTPWPIAAFDVGNPKALNIQWDGKSNILLLQAVSPYSNGDIVIRLVGLATPVTLELVAGQRVVDYRVDVHVPGIGPNTKEIPLGSGLPGSANQLLLGVLDGIAPPGSQQLEVHGADAQAWVFEDTMYLRTRFILLSPGWVGKMASPDGMNAYELTKTSSVLVSRHGEPVELKIEGF